MEKERIDKLRFKWKKCHWCLSEIICDFRDNQVECPECHKLYVIFPVRCLYLLVVSWRTPKKTRNVGKYVCSFLKNTFYMLTDSVVAMEELRRVRYDETIPLENLEGVITYLKEPYHHCFEFSIAGQSNDIFYYLRDTEDKTEFERESKSLMVGAAIIVVTWQYRSKKVDNVIFVKAIRKLAVPDKVEVKFTFSNGLVRNISLSNSTAILELISAINSDHAEPNITAKEVKAMVSRSCRLCAKYTKLQCTRCKLLFCNSCFTGDHLVYCHK